MSISSLFAGWNRLSFRLPALIVTFAAATGIVGGSIAYYIAREGFIEGAKERVELVRNERARAITALVEDTRVALGTLVTRPGLAHDIKELSVEFHKLGDPQRDALIKGYTVNSQFPVGSRSAVHDLGDGSGYSAKHKAVHERLLVIAQLRHLDDLLLVDLKGDIVYTTAKEAEFGTNLLSGPYRDTGAGQVFQRALAAQPPWEQVFVDMKQYDPTGGPAAFMGQAVRDDDGSLAGALIFQLNNPKFREVANHIQDLGNTGEVYLVGADATRRSHTRFSEGGLGQEKLTNEGAVRSAAGFTAKTITRNYKGTPVVAAYAPLDLMGVKWGIVSNIDLAEALEPLNSIAISTIAGILLSTFVIALLGYASARRISRPLGQSLRVMDKLSRGDLHVEIEDGNGIFETRQISAALRTFQGNLRETQRLMTEVTGSQDRLTSLLDSSPTGILVLSSDHKVLFVNDPGAAILGRQKAAFIGETFSFAEIAADSAETESMIAAARRDGVVKDAHISVRVAGSELSLSLSIRRTTYQEREAYLIWFDDITAQRQADEKLRQLNDRFIAFLENTPDYVFIKDTKDRFQAASQALARVAGVPSWRDMLGRTALEIYGKESADIFAAHERPLLDGTAVSLENEDLIDLGGGRVINASVRKVAIKGHDGRISGLLGISRDVTEQKRAEKAMETALSAAKIERQRSQTILDSSPDPVVIVRRDGMIDYVNQQTTKLLGYAPNELIGRSIETLVPAQARPSHGGHVKHFFGAGQARQMGSDRELFVVAKDGHEIPVEIALSPMTHGDEKLVIASVRDISDRKAAQIALLQAKDAAEAATRAKGDFLAAMSHEIRTPMNGVTGMADLLAQTELSDEQRHMVRTIRESGNSLITVINDILDFSKIEAGKMDLESVTMSITDAVEGVASTLTPNATKKGVRIQVFVDPNIPDTVHGDPTRLRQILFNIGGNAVKFSNGKDVQVRAEFANRDDSAQTWLRFSVIDHGIGISKENQAKLFQAFSQAESSTTRRFGGTGLGLAICKRLTEMMNGIVGVDSREGFGSTFYVELPFLAAEGVAPQQKPRDLTSLCVLLLGSDGPRAEAIEAYLKHDGAEVVARETADEALAALKNGPKIDSIMVDLGLDQGRQDKALAALRKAVGGNTPIIVLQDYQNRGARIQNKDVVTVDANPLVRYRVISSVAVAAGRASPQVRTDDDVILQRAKAPTPDEARALGRLILLAEDNLTNQDVIRRQLGLVGYACEIANNGVEALKAFKAGGYALLLTDCHMPEMDGYELTGSIRALEHGTGSRFPIIAVTANALQGEAERCLAAGMDDYITKPIAMPALVTALKKWMPASKEPASKENVSRAPAVKAAPKAVKAAGDGARPVVDERAIKDIFGDDEATFKDILQSFVGPSQDIIEEILAAQAKRTAAGVKDAAHKLKSSARSVGAIVLADLCVALETAGKATDWAAIDALAPKTQDEFREVEEFISKL